MKMNFSEKLIQLRKENGLSQEQLAEKLDISRQAISKWETGESQPDMSKLVILSDILKVSMDELSGKESEIIEKSPTVRREKSFNVLWFIIVFVGLFAGLLGGFFIHSAFVKNENTPIFDNLKISSFSFYDVSSGNSSRTLQIVFSPSISNKDMSYQVIKTDSRGNTISYDAEYINGVCKCIIGADYYSGFTLTAVVSDKNNTYSAGLIEFSLVNQDRLYYDEIWNK